MSAEGGRRRTAAALHVVGAVAIPACLAAGLVELRRAQSGNQLSWAYVVEWPLIAGYGIYLWARLARERRTGATPPHPDAGEPHAPAAEGAPGPDADLLAWQAYIADFEARNPPGGPGLTR